MPFLHNLPWVGAAFGSKSITKTRTELVVFLTPRVIYDSNQMLEATDEIKSGMKEIGSVAKMLGPYQATGTVVLRSWARANADVLVLYMQAYIEGLRWSLDARNKDEAIKLLAEGLKLSPDIASATYSIAIDPIEGLAKDAKLDMEGFTNVLKLRADWTGVSPGAPENYLDLSYYRKALSGL